MYCNVWASSTLAIRLWPHNFIHPRLTIPSEARFLLDVPSNVYGFASFLKFRSWLPEHHGLHRMLQYFLLKLLSSRDLQLATWSLFWLNSIYPCATNFVSPFMLAFLGYRHYACKDNGKVELLLPKKVILTTLLQFLGENLPGSVRSPAYQHSGLYSSSPWGHTEAILSDSRWLNKHTQFMSRGNKTTFDEVSRGGDGVLNYVLGEQYPN